MRNPHGYATFVGDLARNDPTIVERGVRHTEAEIDTFTCGHCNRVSHVLPRCDPADIGGLCKQCMELICPRCVAKATCTPWERKMEEAEAKQQLWDAAGLD